MFFLLRLLRVPLWYTKWIKAPLATGVVYNSAEILQIESTHQGYVPQKYTITLGKSFGALLK